MQVKSSGPHLARIQFNPKHWGKVKNKQAKEENQDQEMWTLWLKNILKKEEKSVIPACNNTVYFIVLNFFF